MEKDKKFAYIIRFQVIGKVKKLRMTFYITFFQNKGKLVQMRLSLSSDHVKILSATASQIGLGYEDHQLNELSDM